MRSKLSQLLLGVVALGTGCVLLVSSNADDTGLAGERHAAYQALASAASFQSTVETWHTRATQLIDRTVDLHSKYDAVEESVFEAEQAIRLFNAQQLKVVIEGFDAVHEAELERRAIQQPQDLEDVPMPLTKDEFRNAIPLDSIVDPSDVRMEHWVVDYIDRVLNERTPPTQVQTTPSPTHSCVTPQKAVQEVHAALVRHTTDGIGMEDHARGARIVHEMTTTTYTPPPQSHQRLGNVWWRRFIPQDWESLLPSGWEEWDARVPLFFSHTFGSKAPVSAKPESILIPLTTPGACWPMDGSNGHVTLALTYPVAVSAITIDHVSKYLLNEPSEQLTSAPKDFRIVAYPPCIEHCHGLSFDVNDPFDLAQGTFERDGTTVQTFATQNLDPPVLGREHTMDEGSCSAAAATTCGVPDSHQGLVAAVQVQILSNWGNEDYTCLYRIRVHGESADL